MKKGIIFDMDGTVWDSSGNVAKSWTVKIHEAGYSDIEITRDDIKNQLNMDLTVLLYQNGYPPEWDEEVFEKVMEQAENFKRYSDQ